MNLKNICKKKNYIFMIKCNYYFNNNDNIIIDNIIAAINQ